MNAIANRLFATALLFATWFAATFVQAAEHNLSVAEAALQRVDYSTIVEELLPAYERGELKDSRGLFLLSRGCMRRDPCKDRAGEITRKAADAGDVQAMINLAGSLGKV